MDVEPPPQAAAVLSAEGSLWSLAVNASSNDAAPAATPVMRPEVDYFVSRRTMIDTFVARHFTWPGTLRLHSAALGWDILRAPLNVLLSPFLILTRLAALICRRVGLRATGDWLARRRILLRTSVGRRVETLILAELLGVPLDRSASARDPSTLARAVLAAPQFREAIRARASPDEADRLGRRIAGALGEYAGSRSAVAEITVALCALVLGALVFRALTPGMVSMAPGVADAIARSTAIASFPLGQTLGGVWYGLFSPEAASWLVGVTVAGLIMLGSVFAAFAGVFADPVQSWLGIHRRRLDRLLVNLETELIGAEGAGFVAREHFYARFLDLWDAIASAFRFIRS